ncbi:hypothetical protein DKM19_13335 [Streptosporangium sp. 'caverna']|nr:hypothetical protein DKM19_13335 [Streptosporangium sp. 'caverna']
MTAVEISMTFALVAVAITLIARARQPGRTDQERKQARMAVVMMFTCWVGAILVGKIILWTN